MCIRDRLEMMSAAQREDHCFAAPATMKGAALVKAGAKLMKLGLAREIQATRNHKSRLGPARHHASTGRASRPFAVTFPVSEPDLKLKRLLNQCVIQTARPLTLVCRTVEIAGNPGERGSRRRFEVDQPRTLTY